MQMLPLHAYRQVRGKKAIRDPAMTLSWFDWLLEKGERNSLSYDFSEARPFWTMWWFRALALLVVIVALIFWFFVLPN